MNLIKINEAEAIIEPFYDGGESCPVHYKYSPLTPYTKTIHPKAKAKVEQAWMAGDITIYPTEETKTGAEKADGKAGTEGAGNAAGEVAPAVILERTCDLDVTGYDMFGISVAGSGNVTVRLILTTENGEETAIEKKPYVGKEVYGTFTGTRLLGIRLEVWPTDAAKMATLNLLWFSLANEEKLPNTKTSGLKFDKNWPGCFEEEYEVKPQIGIYFDKDKLDAMREKVTKSPFKEMYERIKKGAYDAMGTEPESKIEEYLINHSPMLTRPGHCFTGLIETLPALAFVGMMEEDREMIRLAGRFLLSVCVTPHWCESVLGNLPGATWHHRSFLEGLAAKRCAIALDFIGYSLTWHAKNLVYDAMILKGLPRVEADMFAMEYVRYNNQGVVFNDERIVAYIALAAKYPRYAKMLDIAEADYEEMITFCVEEDGGYLEGPGYFSYNFENLVETAHVLARYRGKSIQDYACERLRNASDYALSMLAERPEGLRYMLVNDSYSYGQYSSTIADFYYRITENPIWGSILNQQLHSGGWLETLWMVPDCPDIPEMPFPDGLIALPVSGFTTLRRTLDNGTRTQLHITAGKAYFSHHHEDKGQIILYADGEELLSDRGNVSAIGKKPVSHNLFVPESSEFPYSQPPELGGAKPLYATYTDGVFEFAADLTPAWETGIFEKITRKVTSDVPDTYVVEDEAVCLNEQPMSLRFNTVFPIKEDAEHGRYLICGEKHTLAITPLDHAPVKAVICEDGTNKAGQTVHMLILYPETAKEYKIRTKLELM